MSQSTLDGAFNVPVGQRTAPTSRPTGRTAPGSAGADPLPLPDRATGDTPARPAETRAADTPRPATTLVATPAQSATQPSATTASTTKAGEGSGHALVVIENGQVKYADAGIFVADLDQITANQENPDALYETLKTLRGVQASDARTRLAERVHENLRGALAL